MSAHDRRRNEIPQTRRLLTAGGALLCAVAIALAAYATHQVQDAVQTSLHTAAAFALVHGVAITVLAPQALRRWRLVALWMLLLGTLFFAGSVVLHRVLALPPTLAPLGGGAMILSWLLYAADTLRR